MHNNRVINTNIKRKPYLSHQSIGTGALVVFELDIRVVVGYQLHEPGVVPLDPTLWWPAGGDGVFADVGLVLLKHQGFHLSRVPELGRATQRAAAFYPDRCHHAHNQRQRVPPPVSGRHRNNATAVAAVPHIRLPDTALPRPLLIQQSVATRHLKIHAKKTNNGFYIHVHHY